MSAAVGFLLGLVVGAVVGFAAGMFAIAFVVSIGKVRAAGGYQPKPGSSATVRSLHPVPPPRKA